MQPRFFISHFDVINMLQSVSLGHEGLILCIYNGIQVIDTPQ